MPAIRDLALETLKKHGADAAGGMEKAPGGGRGSALPGARLYDRLQQEGRLRCGSSGDHVGLTTKMVPTMNPETLQEGYNTILRTIYALVSY